MTENKNYQEFALKTIDSFQGAKKRLLFHVCCGPCACYPLLFLAPHFDITIYYANANIFPKEEFDKRLGELKKLLAYIKRDHGYDIGLIEAPYQHEAFMEELRPIAHLGEFSERCFTCYKKRMAEAYDYAEANGYDYFTTVMTISRYKNAQKLNEIGAELEAKHSHTKYLYSDFKKNGGEDKGIKIRKEYDLYSQAYCGCEYSLAEASLRQARK